VYIQELPSAVHTITGVATSITAFVGYTARGIDNRAEQVLSFADYQRLFGGLASDSELSYAVQQFFANNGTEAYVVRVGRHGTGFAQVVFGGLTFNALSSGAWANGQLYIDVDVNGLGQPLPGAVTLTANSAQVTGTGFTNALVNLWLVFAADPTRTPYQVKSVTNPTTLTLAAPFTNPAGATTATVLTDPLAFNLTVTNLTDGAVEPFPNVSLDSNRNNYVAAVVNDPNNGSQLVNVAVPNPVSTLPAVTGVLGVALTTAGVNTALGSLAGTVQLTQGSPGVVGTGTAFTTALQAGQTIAFASDASQTPYQIKSITNDANLTLVQKFSGATTNSTEVVLFVANNDYGLSFGVSSPATLAPLPINVKVFPKTSAIPQTVAGLAAQLQKSLNAALAVQMPGASVQCSASGFGNNLAIRVNASLPQFPDAIVTFSSPAATTGWQDASGPLGLNPPATGGANVAHYALGTGNGTSNSWGGSQTTSSPASPGIGLPWTADLIGDQSTYTGIYALERVDLFNLVSIPDANRATPGDSSALDPNVDPNSIYSAAIELCDRRRAFLLVDPPPNVNTVLAAVDWITSTLAVHDANGAAFFPRLKLPDPLNNFQLRTFAPSGVVAGVYATIDGSRGVWKAPAGTEATLRGVQGLVYKLTDAENGVLNPLGLNCFRTFPVYGSVLWGARTLLGADADTSQWKYVPVRRVALYIEESLYRGTQWVVFEPNDAPLWAAIRLNVGSFMQDLFRKGAFQGLTPKDAYFVKCDSETTTQDDIDRGIVNILVGFAPLKPAEFVIIQIQQMAGQAQS
jgi:phage tail sheath protein FI